MNPIEEEESVDENELGDPILRSQFETASGVTPINQKLLSHSK